MDDIHYKIWGDKVLENEVNPVMVHVRRIRSKFEKIGLKSVILTVWGSGYKNQWVRKTVFCGRYYLSNTMDIFKYNPIFHYLQNNG